MFLGRPAHPHGRAGGYASGLGDVAASTTETEATELQAGRADASTQRSSPAVAYLSESYAAVPASIARARHAVSAHAAAAGIEGERLEDIALLVSEAVTNSVRYAYTDASQGEVFVIAAVVAGELWVVVADDGEGMRARPHEDKGLGVGLALMARLSDGMEVRKRATGGVEVQMRFSLAGAGED